MIFEDGGVGVVTPVGTSTSQKVIMGAVIGLIIIVAIAVMM